MTLHTDESQREMVVARDRVRRIMQGELDKVLTSILDTPGDQDVSVSALLNRFNENARPTLAEHRARLRQEFAETAAATGRLG